MKIPRSICIRGVHYRVLYRVKLSRAWERCGGAPCEFLQGFTDFDKGLIYLGRDLAPDILEQTFAHEVAHVIAGNLGRTFSEGEVDALGAMIREVVKQT